MKVALPKALLRKFGWTRFIASTDIDGAQFAAVLAEIKRERCVHSWRWVSVPRGQDAAAAVRRFENSLRPTEIYCYYGLRADGSRELVGAGTISERLRRSFKHAGFPVVARGFIRRRYRQNGIYGAMLDHRMGLCAKRWKKGLRAIHLGTANPRVLGLLSRRGFHCVGSEVLHGPHVVKDFLHFAKGFASDIERGAAPALRQLMEFCEAIPVVGAGKGARA